MRLADLPVAERRARLLRPCTSCGSAGPGLVLHLVSVDDPRRTVRVVCSSCHRDAMGGAGACRWPKVCAKLTRELLG